MKIDWWTLGIQTVNIAILVWLLQRFFWRPLAAMIDQRRTAAQSTLADSTAKQQAAKLALDEIEQTRASFVAEHDAIIASAHVAATAAATASQAEAAKAAAAQQAAAIAAIAAEQAAAASAWNDRASHLAVEIAARLAARLSGPLIDAAFLADLQSALRTLPKAARADACANGATLQATTATALDTAAQDHARTAIYDALCAAPPITFKTDPALIAGFELSGANLEIANSWRADLAKILGELTHAER